MNCSPEEQKLLDMLAGGVLDGSVGDVREYHCYHSVRCRMVIRNGVPIICRQNERNGTFCSKAGISYPDGYQEDAFDTAERKLEFLQRFGWLIDDEAVKAYSAKYKSRNQEKKG